MVLTLSALVLAAFSSAHAASVTVREVASFPVGTWLENLAVRANGQLLVTYLDVPELWSLDPLTGHSVRLAQFPGVTSALGITEVAHDVFAVATGNYSLATGATPGTSAVWSVDLRATAWNSNATVTKIADVPQAGVLNGIVPSPDGRGILAADSVVGAVYRVDFDTGKSSTVLSGTAYEFPANAVLRSGVNGVHISSSSSSPTLYFTNTGAGTFARVAIHQDGTAAGDVEVVKDGLELPDDFALDPSDGSAVVTLNQVRSLITISADGERVQVAGGSNSTDFATPTAVQFGRTLSDQTTVYVTTGGVRDATGSALTSAKVLAITLN
ncbi:hypothetical protein EXIGLDRAFT_721802 [Exidia glandulosa HHB12029]|uniref:Uncharacterized protein n=1 Tax=Exidia glandulosa HHB12029 TaxID=1314781 RepID=A0A165QH81_EXIGL|nr:hypothetical protein EXIGLDRAFT_721802 [Exidia glandulosa HHB12029]